MKRKFISAFLILFAVQAVSADWPIYKGNIYFTSNNDEITVKNANLKWLFQASHFVYNPIVSDGRVYFVDLQKNIYCLDEHSGKLLWKVKLPDISKAFASFSRATGKVKYPVIRGNRLFISDNIAIYCFDKRTGEVIWARTGMRDEKAIHDPKSWQASDPGRFRPAAKAEVDGIYSNPVILGDRLFYGTRRNFIARDVRHGHILWHNSDIETFSGFPSFYDRIVFTQSMNHSEGRFTLLALDSADGSVIWEKKLPVPVRIFSPVVYNRKVYMPVDKKIFCLDAGTGKVLWDKEYPDLITSNPGFTDREIFFTLGNNSVVSINPENGNILHRHKTGDRSSPYFVTVRDQIYIASTIKKEVGGRELSYARLRAHSFSDEKVLWEFTPPFPGAAYQPSAGGGIMFFPAGNYLYAVGTDYYPRIIEGGGSVYDPYNRFEDKADDEIIREADDPSETPPEPEKITEMRRITVKIEDGKGSAIPARLDITKWDRGRIVYRNTINVPAGEREISIPDADDVEILASGDGFVPKKEIVSRTDDSIKIELDRIEKGKGFIVENVHFETGSAHLRKESLNILDSMLESLKRNPSIKLEVRGHTDSTGSRDLNMRLSQRRADAVVEYMVKNGISPERLTSAGLGPDKPVADNDTPEGRRLNRRTEFFVTDR